MPILASLNAKNRSKSPFSIGELFSIISEFTVLNIGNRSTQEELHRVSGDVRSTAAA